MNFPDACGDGTVRNLTETNGNGITQDIPQETQFPPYAGTESRGGKTRHSIEFRHKSWFDDEVTKCLKAHAVAVCMSDAPDWPM